MRNLQNESAETDFFPRGLESYYFNADEEIVWCKMIQSSKNVYIIVTHSILCITHSNLESVLHLSVSSTNTSSTSKELSTTNCIDIFKNVL